MLFIHAAGALVAMPFTGWLTTKIGSDWTCRITSLLLCIAVPFITLFQEFVFLGFAFFSVGFFGGSLDVAMNGQAVVVERKWQSSIMSSFHGMFSVGMAAGAGIGALFTKFEVSLTQHLLIMVGLVMLICLWVAFHLVNESNEADSHEKEESGGFKLPTLTIMPIGLIAFCGMTGEGSMADWSALYMKNVVGGNETYGALTIGSFATAMTLGRFFGDYFTDKFGKARMLVINSLIAISGLVLVLSILQVWLSLFGFFLVGLGLATVVPVIYSIAGNTKGVSPSVGISMASTIGYAGFFVGPPVIGYLADDFGLRVGLLFTLCLLFVMLLLILAQRKKV